MVLPEPATAAQGGREPDARGVKKKPLATRTRGGTRPCADGGGPRRRGKRSDSQQGTAGEPSRAGAAKTIGATRLGAAGVGQKAQGGTRETKTR